MGLLIGAGAAEGTKVRARDFSVRERGGRRDGAQCRSRRDAFCPVAVVVEEGGSMKECSALRRR